MSFRQILVALDRTPLADQVFDQGIELAQKYDAHLLLLHCVSDVADVTVNQPLRPVGIAHPWPSATFPQHALLGDTSTAQQLAQTNSEVARQWLMQYQQKAETQGYQAISSDVRVGKPATTIMEVATATDADLIVVGRRDRPGIEEFLLGSVSKSVVDRSPCAVLIVPQLNASFN